MLPYNNQKYICNKLIEKIHNTKIETNNNIYKFSINLDEKLNFSEILGFFEVEKKIYFNSVKLNTEFIGLGEAYRVTGTYSNLNETFNTVEELQKEYSGNIYSVLTFAELNKEKDQLWSDFNELEFFIPTLEFVNNSSCVTINLMLTKAQLTNKQDIKALIMDSLKSKSKKTKPFPKLISEKTTPAKSKWTENIKSLEPKMKNAELIKIVLARKSKLTFENSIEAIQLMKELLKAEPECSIFYYQLNLTTTYLAVTPESLFYRHNNQVSADVLAGTIEVGDTKEKTKQLARILQNSKKDNLEHNEVFHYIETILKDLSNVVTVKEKLNILKLSKVQHLKSIIEAKVSSDISDLTILKKLHPTPAIAGVPKHSTLDLIKSIEPFNRGLFAGAIGVLGRHITDIAVGIRSCLICKNELCLFVGSGILEASSADNEWEELNRKVLNYKNIITVC
jgi:menaquinone-specific isochorismate synthase